MSYLCVFVLAGLVAFSTAAAPTIQPAFALDKASVNVGATVRATCTPDASETVTAVVFYLKNIEVPQDTAHSVSGSGSGPYIMTITTKATDDGAWTCASKNANGVGPKAAATQTLTVITTPTKVPTFALDKASVNEGATVVATCTPDTTETVTAVVFYLKNNEVAADTTHVLTGTGSGPYKFNITTKAADKGDWTCASKNTGGTGPKATAITLTVTKPTPTIAPTFALDRAIAFEGATVKATCTPDTSETTTVDGAVFYLKNSEVPPDATHVVSGSGPYTMTITTKATDAGGWTCASRNTNGAGPKAAETNCLTVITTNKAGGSVVQPLMSLLIPAIFLKFLY